MARSRKWCFTINNYTDETLYTLKSLAEHDTTVFLIYGKETGECGTPHLQGFIYYKNPVRAATVRKSIPGHITLANGSVEQNVDYCSKDGDITHYGTKPASDERKGELQKERWDKIISLSQAGDEQSIREDYPGVYFRCLKTIRAHRTYSVSNLEGAPSNIWYYGPTGTGKSHRARTFGAFYLKNINKWWDGYKDEDNVIIEEWSPESNMTTQSLKKWADKYYFNAEIKGGQISIRPRTIIVTSNFSMRECFIRDADYTALKRRFQEIYCINHVDEELMD